MQVSRDFFSVWKPPSPAHSLVPAPLSLSKSVWRPDDSVVAGAALLFEERITTHAAKSTDGVLATFYFKAVTHVPTPSACKTYLVAFIRQATPPMLTWRRSIPHPGARGDAKSSRGPSISSGRRAPVYASQAPCPHTKFDLRQLVHTMF